MSEQPSVMQAAPTGRMSIEPLRDTATRMARGRYECVVGDEMVAVAEDYECAKEIAARWNTIHEMTKGKP